MAPTLTQFVSQWQASTRSERSSAQEHFLGLCDVLGHPHPAEVDPRGEWFTFEKGATKASGGEGFADVWKSGFFAWEYKGKRKNLSDAYVQLQQYRDALASPPLLVVCDLDRFIVRTNFNGTVPDEYHFHLSDLLKPAPLEGKRFSALEVLRYTFHEPERLRPTRTTADVTEEAAGKFALLAESLRKRGADPERAARFLMRLLFCLFAEDIVLLPNSLFTRLVATTRQRPDDFNKRVRLLFEAMSHGGSFGVEDIRHFNGGLFDSDEALDLTESDLWVLADTTKLDWKNMEPAIFGTLFERSLDPSKRAQLGAHYTSPDDILLIVEPVLMEPLRRRWEEVKRQAETIIADRDRSADRGYRTRKDNELARLLMDFSAEIAAVKVLDPACGSGNFLYVALKKLLDLENEVSVFATMNGLPRLMHGLGQATDETAVGPAQLYGIEINPYAQQLASVVVWIGYIQWLQDNGYGAPPEPILKPLHNIRLMDAILAYDDQGNPVEPEWPQADVIIGNPPFLGDKKMRAELGDKTVNDLRRLYSGRIPGQSDLVCYWFEKAREMIAMGRTQRAGLLATQGIRGGANRRVLERIKETGDIYWAYSDRNWILEGANVHVSMVGFDGGVEKSKILDGLETTAINPDLTGAANVSAAKRLLENQTISFIGTQKSGPFDLTEQQAQEMLSYIGNPNGRSNADVVKRWINALDVTRGSRHMWIIDFGATARMEEAAQYERPFEYVRKYVKPLRDSVRRKNHREKWWLFGETRPGMRKVLSTLDRYIATPLVSKHRIFVWVAPEVIPENLLVVIARSDDYFFGVLHSRLHELWARSMGTQLREAESGQRYTPTTTFETFPFPWPPGKEPHDDPRVQAIGIAARELVEKRDAWLNPPGATEADLKKRTLTNLYNQRPTWLDLAHQKLDRAVLDAYGWPHDLPDEEILSRLLALNLERAAAQGSVSPASQTQETAEDD
ncbi:MAG TPA: DNA methyltransferase [Chloroflexia bacterium]|jgi:type II restriction/modification system DNA methylase subunit YeeA